MHSHTKSPLVELIEVFMDVLQVPIKFVISLHLGLSPLQILTFTMTSLLLQTSQ